MRYITITYMILAGALGILAALAHALERPGNPADDPDPRRQALVAEVEQHVRETASYLGRNKLAPRVIAALAAVPRHEFVPAGLQRWAYADRPLPIGNGQTISQPYIVAIMTELLELETEDCRVLDIGTGSGYQAAILAELCTEVWGIEIIPALAAEASERLERLGYHNITVRAGDGFNGWPDEAPFDGIIVAAAGDELPPPLLTQLKPGGRIVMPVRDAAGYEVLIVAHKEMEGTINTTEILPVRFVPLTRKDSAD